MTGKIGDILLDKYLDENVLWKIELHWLPLAVWHWWQLSWKFKVMCSGSRSAGSRSPPNHVLVLLIMHCMFFRTQLKKNRSVTVINLLSDELIWTLNNNTFVVILHKRKTISSLYYTWKKKIEKFDYSLYFWTNGFRIKLYWTLFLTQGTISWWNCHCQGFHEMKHPVHG